MVVCPNCNHQNPEGSLQCENCYTPLPTTTSCPNCGASVQTDATFCGQCGFNLQAETSSMPSQNLESLLDSSEAPPENPQIELPEVEQPTAAMSSPVASPWDDDEQSAAAAETGFNASSSAENDLELNNFGVSNDSTEVMNSPIKPEDFDISFEPESVPESEPMPWETSQSEPMPWETSPPTVSSEANEVAEEHREDTPETFEPEESMSFGEDEPTVSGTQPMVPPPPPPPKPIAFTPSQPVGAATQLQTQKVSLLHVQTNTKLEIAYNLDVIHIGKPNSQIPPDIDVAGFPDSEVVSRIHADIRVEGDAYFIEDVGSSNGTYINHTPLLKGNRHRLRAGDRIALGKGDLVTFIFQID